MKPEFKQCLKEYECQLPFSKYKEHLPKFRVYVAGVYFHKFFFFFRLKIVGTRVDASDIFAIGTLMDDYLGLVS